MHGRVLIFWPHRHYGFLQNVTNGEEHFFHETDLPEGSPLPEKNQRVTFELGTWQGKQKAFNVRFADGAR